MEFAALLITIIFSGVLGVIVYFNNPRSVTNRLLIILSITVASWSFIMYGSLRATPETTLIWIRLTTFFAVLMSTEFLLLSFTVPHQSLKPQKFFRIVILLFSLMAMVVTLTPYVFPRIEFGSGGFQPIAGPGMAIFAPVVNGYAVIAMVVLILRFIKARAKEKLQLGYVLGGIVLMLGFIIATIFIPVLFFSSVAFVSFAPLYVLIFLGATTYAIIRHRLLDIRLLVARTASYALLTIIIAVFYAALITVVGGTLLGLTLTLLQHTLLIILTVVVAFSFPAVQGFVGKLTDRVFFKNKYDSNELLGKLSKIMAEKLLLEDVTHGVLKELLAMMKITHGAFVLLEKELIADVKSEGLVESMALADSDVQILSGKRELLAFEDLDEGPVKDLMRRLNIVVVAYLQSEDELIGFLMLGSKESGDIYFEQDIELLKILAPEAAVAIQNAKQYEEIRRFNITLQEEVDRATQSLQETNEKLIETDKLKDEFLSLASHELKSPLATLKLSLSTILDGYTGEIPEKTKQFLTASYNENDRLIRLVGNMLNLSRIQEGRLKYTFAPFSLRKLILDTVENMQLTVRERGIYLNFQETTDDALNVSGDQDKLREVIINFIGNAVKFTKTGGITIRAHIDEKEIIVSVSDTGPGITDSDMKRLFQRFSQVGEEKQKTSGTGLGLYISKKIVEGHGGRVWVASKVEKGTTFYFSLPYKGEMKTDVQT